MEHRERRATRKLYTGDTGILFYPVSGRDAGRKRNKKKKIKGTAHRDPLQNVAGTSLTASNWIWRKWNLRHRMPNLRRTLGRQEWLFPPPPSHPVRVPKVDLRLTGEPEGSSIQVPRDSTHLILMRYCANATASGFPVMVMVRSVAPPSLSSQLLILIMAPEIWRISAILVPPFPMMQPINSFGTVISCVWLFAAGCCLFVLLVRSWLPANAANATINAQMLEKFWHDCKVKKEIASCKNKYLKK